MNCVNCGKELADSAKFCTNCGTKVEVKVASVEETPVVESASEAEEVSVVETVPVAEETPVAVEVSASEEAPVAEKTAVAEEAPVVEETSVAAESVAVEVTGEAPVVAEKAEKKAKKEKVKKEKKGSKGPLIFLIILFILILGAGGVAIWYFTGDDFNSRKNMKLAEECFAEGEMEDALEYYEEALERDETLTDAYTKIADIYLAEGKYEDAIEILADGLEAVAEEDTQTILSALDAAYNKGVDQYKKDNNFDAAFALLEMAKENFGESKYTSEKTTLYIAKSDAKVAENDFYGALSVLNEGEADTGSPSFNSQKVLVYNNMANFYINIGEYSSVIYVLHEGYADTNDASLLTRTADVYMAYAKSELDNDNYGTAIDLLYEGYGVTSDESLKDEVVNVYLVAAEDYLARGDFEGAYVALGSGVSDTDSEILKARREEILANIYIISEQVYVDDILEYSMVYNEDGVIVEEKWYDEYANATDIITYDSKGRNLSELYVEENEHYEYVYENDLLVLVKVTDLNGNPLREKSYEYDENGNMTSFLLVDLENGKTIDVGEYVYDEKGRLLYESETYDAGAYAYSNEYAYDDADNLVLYKSTYNGEVMYWEEYEYNELKQRITTISYDPKGKIISVSSYAYKGIGKLVDELVVTDDQGNVTSSNSYQYDDRGNMITNEFFMYDAEGNVTYDYSTKYEYNEDDELVYEQYWSDTEGTSSDCSYIYEYDSNRNAKIVTIYENGEFIKEYRYEYDNFGNLVYSASRISQGTYEDRYDYVYEYGYKE